jgi:hypothetical protein
VRNLPVEVVHLLAHIRVLMVRQQALQLRILLPQQSYLH